MKNIYEEEYSDGRLFLSMSLWFCCNSESGHIDEIS